MKSGKKVIGLPVNPVVHRGQDPELFWLDKYGNDDREELLRVDVRSLYRHEHIAPETLIRNLYRVTQEESQQLGMFSVNELFGNALEKDELEKVSGYYRHQDGWTNRLIQGDSLLTMASLLEREGMAGQVQMIYIDPPYGIKYGSNWQIQLNNRDVKDGSDENVHLVRSVMDEVFGSENFVSEIVFLKTSGQTSTLLPPQNDYIILYAKQKDKIKYRQLYKVRKQDYVDEAYRYIEFEDKSIRKLKKEELEDTEVLKLGNRFRIDNLTSQSGPGDIEENRFKYEGKTYRLKTGSWKTSLDGLQRLVEKNRIWFAESNIYYKRYENDFPIQPITNVWDDTVISGFSSDKQYVVQTSIDILKRCILMSTDPGDLVLDSTCGSGTTAYVAEQFGRRWITIDTSRIAINIAKQRLMTAVYPYYKLYDEEKGDIRQAIVACRQRGDANWLVIHDIAYWMLDDDYDGSNFVVKQVFFCGGDRSEFEKWRKGLANLSESRKRRKQELQDTLKIEIDEEAFDRLYDHRSHPIEVKRQNQRVAVRLVSQFGEESTKILAL